VPPCLLDFARPVTPLDAGDDMAKALHLMRTAGMTALPVVSEGVTVGHLREREAVMAAELSPDADSPKVAEFLQTIPDLRAAPSEPLASAWERVRQEDLPFLTVVDPQGRLLGIVTPGELLAGLRQDLRPASVGGLATPLGVYLTTLHVRAGAGDLGLVLTGALLMALDLIAVHGTRLAGDFLPGVAASNPATAGLSDLGLLVGLVTFFSLVRLTPLAGTHAAEHQVVHAIEKGEPLRADRVAIQPREHPRCGTNLAAAALSAQFILPRVVESPALAGLAVVVLFFTWRKLGWALQRVFTTKRARPRQLDGAIRAGRDLLVRYSARPAYRAPAWRCVWNTGAVQILLGALVVLWTFEWTL
jgi:CBS domain-containing protein